MRLTRKSIEETIDRKQRHFRNLTGQDFNPMQMGWRHIEEMALSHSDRHWALHYAGQIEMLYELLGD